VVTCLVQFRRQFNLILVTLYAHESKDSSEPVCSQDCILFIEIFPQRYEGKLPGACVVELNVPFEFKDDLAVYGQL
jgi:hypothetical protein